jgi:hypothetical protein
MGDVGSANERDLRNGRETIETLAEYALCNNRGKAE